jgi:hypothetical protein
MVLNQRQVSVVVSDWEPYLGSLFSIVFCGWLYPVLVVSPYGRDCFGCLFVLLLFRSVDLLNISLWTLTTLHIGLILATPPLKKRNSVTTCS